MFVYSLVLSYDGTDFHGWQVQPNVRSVQGELNRVLSILLRTNIATTGAGRTDAGVHALGQVVSFISPIEIDTYKFNYSLNVLLPSSIAVKSIERAPAGFNARFSAKSRSYLYVIGKEKDPFYDRFTAYVHHNIDLKFLNKLSDEFTGMHDFSALTKNLKEQENTVCTVSSARWRMFGNRFLFNVSADRFLHGMVRTMVGTILRTSKHEGSPKDIKEILRSKDRAQAGEAFPAKGLILYKVGY